MTTRDFEAIQRHIRWILKTKEDAKMFCEKLGCMNCVFISDGKCAFKTLKEVLTETETRKVVAVHP
jgi:hypothetical protein